MIKYYKLVLKGVDNTPQRVEIYTSMEVATTIGKMHLAKNAKNSYDVFIVDVSEEILITS